MQEQNQFEQDLKTINEFVSKEENKQTALNLVLQIKEVIGSNTFTFNELCKKFDANNEQQLIIRQQLLMLKMFKLLVFEHKNDIEIYRIDINDVYLIKSLEKEIENKENELIILRRRLQTAKNNLQES